MSVIYKPSGRALEYSELALNLGTGCTHGCDYCYAPACRYIEKSVYFGGFTRKKGVINEIQKDLSKLKSGKILLSFTHDPYQPGVEPLTREAIRCIKKAGLNFQVLTKGGKRAEHDFDLYGEGDSFATTLTFSDPERSLKIEPGAATPDDRIETIKNAYDSGIDTWVSFEPVLDDQSVFDLYEKTKSFVNLYKVGKVSRYPSTVKDWRAFGNEIIKRMNDDGKAYYIKKDLADHLK